MEGFGQISIDISNTQGNFAPTILDEVSFSQDSIDPKNSYIVGM